MSKVSKYFNPSILKHSVVGIMLLFSSMYSRAQKTSSSYTEDSTNARRQKILLGGYAVATTGSLIGLNELWYKNYPRSSFQFINDNAEWLQMDKVGHAMTSYQLGRLGYESMLWSGMPENRALWLGGSLGLIYLSGVELLDAHSSQWGFSMGDQFANVAGTTMYITQQKIWKEQRIVLKFSYSNSRYAMLNSAQLGRNFQQRILKDYNGQTYWASINIHRFMASDAAFPKWMNVAFGYGADGMTSANFDVNDVNNFQRTREFYLSFDADLNQIRWPKKWMKITAQILSFIKLPSPAIKMQSDGKVKLYALHF